MFVKPAAAIASTLAAAFVLLLPQVATAAVPHLDLSYDLDGSPTPAPPSLNQLDLYTPDGATPDDERPVVVYVHGGGWRKGDKRAQIADKRNLFTEAGYVFASLNYRLSPDTINGGFPADRIRFPDHPADVGEALAWIDRNVGDYGGDPSRILLIGHSAGAHLVALVSTDPSYLEAFGMDPRHVIGTVPLDTDGYDVTERVTTGTAQAKAIYYNAFATPAENAVDDTWARASPIVHASQGDPEFLIVTQLASSKRVQNSREMAAALGQDPDESVLPVPYDHAGINDAVGSDTDPAGETDAIMSFFDRMVAASETTKVRILDRPPSKLRVDRNGTAKARFRFEAAKAAASFECRLDDRDWKRCSSPKSYEVEKGKHAFRVRAIASNGESGPAKSIEFRVRKRR